MDKKTTLLHIMDDLPAFAKSYVVALSKEKKTSTAVTHATEIRAFLTFLSGKEGTSLIKHMDSALLENVSSEVIDEYLVNVSQNTKATKCFCLSAFFLYLVKGRVVSFNPFWEYDIPSRPAVQKQNITPAMVYQTLLGIASGTHLSEREAKFSDRLRLRDMSIIALLYYCHLPLSKCAALNTEQMILGEDTATHLNKAWDLLKEKEISDVAGLLYGWLTTPNKRHTELYQHFHTEGTLLLDGEPIIIPPPASAILTAYLLQAECVDALFLSLRQRRLSERTIEYTVHKYFNRFANIHATTKALAYSYQQK